MTSLTDVMEKLKQLFYDPETGFVDATKLYKKAKQVGLNVNRKQVDAFYKDQAINQVLKPVRRPKQFSSVVAGFPSDQYQMDLMVYDRFRSPQGHYQYILCVIDIYSRYADAVALTSKGAGPVLEGVKRVFDRMGAPRVLWCDNGPEFANADMEAYTEAQGVEVRFTDPYEINKNAVVERFNGTLARQLQKVRATTKNYNWQTYLDKVVKNYNTTEHSTTGQTPLALWEDRKGVASKQRVKWMDPKFAEGDKVRLVEKKTVFTKGDAFTYSGKVYVVNAVKKGRVFVEGLERGFKPYEIKKVNDLVEVERPHTQSADIAVERLLAREDINPDRIIDNQSKNNRVLTRSKVGSPSPSLPAPDPPAEVRRSQRVRTVPRRYQD